MTRARDITVTAICMCGTTWTSHLASIHEPRTVRMPSCPACQLPAPSIHDLPAVRPGQARPWAHRLGDGGWGFYLRREAHDAADIDMVAALRTERERADQP